jgi:photosystem II stability/assembly factor-like uncharacterized protein
MRTVFALCLSLALFSCTLARGDRRVPAEGRLTGQSSGTDALLIGIHALNDRVAWAAGTGGVFLRTTNGGATWESGVVPGADTLQFRDVRAFSADVAYLLSIGHGASSRIYKTVDGGRNWDLQFINEEPRAFFDCFDFWDQDSGIVFSDEVGGGLPVARTLDGRTWTVLPEDSWPEALEGEGGFAASGTCIRTLGRETAVIGTGNSPRARIHITRDRGESWSVASTPIPGGDGAGITSLAFRDERRGVALGGDLGQPDSFTDNVAVTNDGSRNWHLGGRPTFRGAVYGSSYVPGRDRLVAVGPGGASLSLDDGRTWTPLDTLNYWSVDFGSPGAGWAVGPEGRITKITF